MLHWLHLGDQLPRLLSIIGDGARRRYGEQTKNANRGNVECVRTSAACTTVQYRTMPNHIKINADTGPLTSPAVCVPDVSEFLQLPSREFFCFEHPSFMEVDAAAVHLTNGAWGLVAAGLFTSEAGYRASYHADRVHL